MTNRFYLSRFFNVEEYANFIECLNEVNNLHLLDDLFNNEIINDSLNWSHTPQGSNYWSKLHDKLMEEETRKIYKNYLKLMVI